MINAKTIRLRRDLSFQSAEYVLEIASFSYSTASRILSTSSSASSSEERTLRSALRALSTLFPRLIYLKPSVSSPFLFRCDVLPSWGPRDRGEEGKNQSRDKKLENDNHLPIPFPQTPFTLRAGIIDPEADERPNRIKHLPEGHDLPTDVRWCEFADVNWASRWQA